MLTVVGTLALDTLARVKALARPEETGGILEVVADAPGGTGGNVATAYARLGGATRLLASVGLDFAGSTYERELLRLGIDLSLLERVEERTSRAYVFFDGAGGQMTYFYAGASKRLAGTSRPLGRAHFAAGEISAYPALMETA